jgi:transposase
VRVQSENKIKVLVLPYLSVGKRGKKSNICLENVFRLILKRVKTGTQWRELSTREFFEHPVPWQTIYYYFNKWSKDGSFLKIWQQLLQNNKHLLDLSTTQFDGSHTPCKRGGEQVGYQGRKSCKTSNSLILCDNNGLPIVVGKPQSGNHNDLYNINQIFDEMIALLETTSITMSGVFMNADAGFDSKSFKKNCDSKSIELNVKENSRSRKNNLPTAPFFDDVLYDKNRYKIERTNAWMDAYKGVLIRFEKLTITWWNMLWLSIIAIFIKKIKC